MKKQADILSRTLCRVFLFAALGIALLLPSPPLALADATNAAPDAGNMLPGTPDAPATASDTRSAAPAISDSPDRPAPPISDLYELGLSEKAGESATDILLRAHAGDTRAMALAVVGYELGLNGFPRDRSMALNWSMVPQKWGALLMSDFLEAFIFRDASGEDSKLLYLDMNRYARRSPLAPLFKKAGLFDVEQRLAAISTEAERRGEQTEVHEDYKDRDHMIESVKAVIALFRSATDKVLSKDDEYKLDAWLQQSGRHARRYLYFAATTHDVEKDAPDWRIESVFSYVAQRGKAGKEANTDRAMQELMLWLQHDQAEAREVIDRAHAGDMAAMRRMAIGYATGAMGFCNSYSLMTSWRVKAALHGDALSMISLASRAGDPENDAESWPWARLAMEYGDRSVKDGAATILRAIEGRISAQDLEEGQGELKKYREIMAYYEARSENAAPDAANVAPNAENAAPDIANTTPDAPVTAMASDTSSAAPAISDSTDRPAPPISDLYELGLSEKAGESATDILLRAHAGDTRAMALAMVGYELGLNGFPENDNLALAWALKPQHWGAPLMTDLLGAYWQRNMSPDEQGSDRAFFINNCLYGLRSPLAPLFKKAGLFDVEQRLAAISTEAERRGEDAGLQEYVQISESLLEYRKKEISLFRSGVDKVLGEDDEVTLDYNMAVAGPDLRRYLYFAATTHDPEKDAPNWRLERILSYVEQRLKADRQADVSPLLDELALCFLYNADEAVQIMSLAHAGDIRAIRSMALNYTVNAMNFCYSTSLSRQWLWRGAMRSDALSMLALAADGSDFEKYATNWAWASLAAEYGDPQVRDTAAAILRALEERLSTQVLEQGRQKRSQYQEWLTDNNGAAKAAMP